MSIKGIIFDKDGTLFDYHQTWMPLIYKTAMLAANNDRNLALKLLRATGWNQKTHTIVADSPLAVSTNSEIAQIWAQYLTNGSARKVTDILNYTFTNEGPKSAHPVTDLRKFLKMLVNDGYLLGVATSDSETSTRAMLDHFHITPQFSFIAGYDSGYGVKPDPSIINYFCQLNGLKEHEVVMIGDNIHDIKLGRNAQVGCCIGVLTGTSDRATLAVEADFVLSDITKITKLIQTI